MLNSIKNSSNIAIIASGRSVLSYESDYFPQLAKRYRIISTNYPISLLCGVESDYHFCGDDHVLKWNAENGTPRICTRKSAHIRNPQYDVVYCYNHPELRLTFLSALDTFIDIADRLIIIGLDLDFEGNKPRWYDDYIDTHVNPTAYKDCLTGNHGRGMRYLWETYKHANKEKLEKKLINPLDF